MLHTYEVITEDKKYRVKIPDDWKITFGQVQTGVRQFRRGQPGRGESFCLRIYETENKQRMIINNVISFRDMSIPIEEMTAEVINIGANENAWDEANMVEAWDPLDFVALEDEDIEVLAEEGF